MSTQHIVRRTATISEQLRNSDLPVLLQQLYANRQVTSADEVTYSLDKLLDYRQLKDCEKAADIIADAITENRMILIVGDYDADGATSTAVMLRSLHAFGHSRCAHLVPNRFDFGYGLSPELVEVALQYNPELIITVDNGISSLAGVALANQHEVPVVVTDHHLAGDTLPDAAAIVNPNQPGCDFPSKVIAGVGVAFYVMLAVRAALRERGRFTGSELPNMAGFLDLVALGTVADVVPLDVNNRILVDQGLKRIRSRACCAGIKAILSVAGKAITSCCTQDFGFTIAPRLNAAGRLEDMSIGIECLLTDDDSRAAEIASLLDGINKERRTIEAGMLQQAMRILDQQFETIETDSAMVNSVCLYQPDWHQGVVGLLASRIKDRVHRPVIAFAKADNSESELKGSARSIPGIHIRDALDCVDRQCPGLIIKFGGHAMAAGLSINIDQFDRFEQVLEAVISDVIDADILQQKIETDGCVASDALTLSNAEMIRYAGPWGQRFVAPLFDDEFQILDHRVVGEKHLKMQLRKASCEQILDAIAFNTLDTDLPDTATMRMVYRMDVNEFRGNRRLQLIVEYIEGA